MLKMVHKTLKKLKCPIVSKKPTISKKSLDIHKSLLNCKNNKCGKILQKEIEINEKCFFQNSYLLFNDKNRLKYIHECQEKEGLTKNLQNKFKCEKKCSKEFDAVAKLKPDQININNSKFSFYDKELDRLRKNEEERYPEFKELNNLTKESNLLFFTIEDCKDSDEKKKLNKKMRIIRNKINKIIEKMNYDFIPF